MLGDVVQNKVRRHPWQIFVIDDHDGGVSQSPLSPVDAVCRGVRTMRAKGTEVQTKQLFITKQRLPEKRFIGQPH